MPKIAQQKKKMTKLEDQPLLLNEEFDLEIDFSAPAFPIEDPPKRSTRSAKGSTQKDLLRKQSRKKDQKKNLRRE